MKKLISLLLIASIITSLLLSFLSCGNNKPQYETIKLSTTNYSEYIVFNYYFTDLDTKKVDGKYEVSCVIHAETSSSNADYEFENVVITLRSSKNNYLYQIGDITLNLNSIGSSHGTAQHYHSSKLSSTVNNDWGYKVKSISGTVKVPIK